MWTNGEAQTDKQSNYLDVYGGNLQGRIIVVFASHKGVQLPQTNTEENQLWAIIL